MQSINQRRATRDAKIQDEEAKYRMQQFYMILLKADKARLLSMEKSDEREENPQANKAA